VPVGRAAGGTSPDKPAVRHRARAKHAAARRDSREFGPSPSERAARREFGGASVASVAPGFESAAAPSAAAREFRDPAAAEFGG
jgi:hypothetical protein